MNNSLTQRGVLDLASSRNRRLAARRRARRLSPVIEGLEDRVVMSTVNWVGPSGGDWDTAANWNPARVPTASDDAHINLDSAGTITLSSSKNDSVHSLATNSSTTVKVVNGSLSLGAGNSTIGGPVEVVSGATLSVNTGASVFIDNGQTITVNLGGAMTIGAATVAIDNYGGTTQGITVGGTLTATGASFTTRYGTGVGGNSSLTVPSKGHLIAANTNFAWDSFSLGDGSILKPGDLKGDTFNQTTITAPIGDVPLLAGNVVFADIDILPGSISSGTIELTNAIATSPSPKLRYVFAGPFEVKSGATLKVDDKVSVWIDNGQTITVDLGGAMTIGAATVAINNYGGTTQGITVGGTLTATGASFTTRYGTGVGGNSSLTVPSKGHLIAANTNFAWDSFSLGDGSILKPGDLKGDTFNQTTITAPIGDVPLLAGNVVFADIDILPGSISSGTIELTNAIATSPSPKLRYVFAGPFEVKSGATLKVDDKVSVWIDNGQTITVDLGGAMTIGAATVAIDNYGGTTQGITVGGTLTATGASFTTRYGTGVGGNSSLTVPSKGHLIAANTNFAWDSFNLNNGSVLNSGDLTNDTFIQTTVSAPGTDIPLLAGPTLTANDSFADVDIIAGGLNSGQSLTLGLMGSASTAKLLYVFTGPYEVKSGATLAISASVHVLINNGQTIAVDAGGAMTVGAATVEINNYGGTAQGLAVAGMLTTTGASFTTYYGTGVGGDSPLTVASGGHLTATNTSFAWDSLTLNTGSAGQLAADTIATQLTIDSGSTFSQTGNVIGNDFSSASAKVVATGSSTAKIYMTNNYWGSMAIAPKITDHTTNSSLPTVVYNPPQQQISPAGVGAHIAVANPMPVTFSTASQTVTLSATVTSGATKVPGGSVIFTILNGINIIGTPVTVPVANGLATPPSYTLRGDTAAGTYTIQAIYLGTASFLGDIDASQTLTVKPAATTTTAAPEKTFYSTTAQSVTLSAKVQSAAGTVNEGTVTFTVLNGATIIATSPPAPVGNGMATGKVNLPPGMAIDPYTIRANYSDTANFSDSRNNSVLEVNSSATTTTVTSSAPQGSVFGQTVIFTAVVTPVSPGAGTPTGTVTFKDGTTVLGTGPVKLIGGAATLATSSLVLGSNSITVVYGGDSHFTTSPSTALTQIVSKDSTKPSLISSAPQGSVFGQTVIFTAVVIPASPGTGTPTGTVTFYNGSNPLGAAVALEEGVATIQTSGLSVGTHTIKAVYSGDADFTGSMSTLSQIVNSSSSAVIAALSVSPGEPSITAIQPGTPAAPLIQDQALEQVSSEHRGKRHGAGRQTADRKPQVTATGSGPRLSRKSHVPERLIHIGRKDVLTSEAIAHENKRHGVPRK